jgi:hypothetical protein
VILQNLEAGRIFRGRVGLFWDEIGNGCQFKKVFPERDDVDFWISVHIILIFFDIDWKIVV